jgi:SAM-dependent methyltransferase
VDRYYIENFLAREAESIRGRCLEVMNRDYTRRFGGDRVESSEVIDINPNNAKATIIGDLTDAATLQANHYDCFILTQTLPVIHDVRSVVRHCYNAVKPGGTLLITAPCLCRYSPHPEDHWRFTDRSLARLITDNTEGADLAIESQGNLIASIAFLTGMASEELTPEELDFLDPRFPITVMARVRKS